MAAKSAGNGTEDDNTDSLIVLPERERSQSASNQNQDETNKNWKIERTNLLNISKICIKTLIDGSLKRGRTLTDDFIPLKQFFIVMEHIFRHGIKCTFYICYVFVVCFSFITLSCDFTNCH